MPEDSDTSENVYKSLNLLKKKNKNTHPLSCGRSSPLFLVYQVFCLFVCLQLILQILSPFASLNVDVHKSLGSI